LNFEFSFSVFGFLNESVIPLPKKLLTIFTLSPLSPKLTNGENGENVRFVLFFGINMENKI